MRSGQMLLANALHYYTLGRGGWERGRERGGGREGGGERWGGRGREGGCGCVYYIPESVLVLLCELVPTCMHLILSV